MVLLQLCSYSSVLQDLWAPFDSLFWSFLTHYFIALLQSHRSHQTHLSSSNSSIFLSTLNCLVSERYNINELTLPGSNKANKQPYVTELVLIYNTFTVSIKYKSTAFKKHFPGLLSTSSIHPFRHIQTHTESRVSVELSTIQFIRNSNTHFHIH